MTGEAFHQPIDQHHSTGQIPRSGQQHSLQPRYTGTRVQGDAVSGYRIGARLLRVFSRQIRQLMRRPRYVSNNSMLGRSVPHWHVGNARRCQPKGRGIPAFSVRAASQAPGGIGRTPRRGARGLGVPLTARRLKTGTSAVRWARMAGMLGFCAGAGL